ncbi:hypothetical protein CCP3SC1_280031 [Gammaproteobacteria bacterium]
MPNPVSVDSLICSAYLPKSFPGLCCARIPYVAGIVPDLTFYHYESYRTQEKKCC